MPSGDSVSVPGWDGVIAAEQGNPWVPTGISYWELGTSKDPVSKASSDFEKRQGQISAEEAAQATFVFVTPRRWPGKTIGSIGAISPVLPSQGLHYLVAVKNQSLLYRKIFRKVNL